MQNSIPSINVLDIPMFDGNIEMAVDFLLQNNAQHNKTILVSETGAHGVVHAQMDEQFHRILRNFSINLPDGMPNVWIGRIKGSKNMKVCIGREFFEAMIRASANKSINHFLCGGADDVAEQLAKVCNTKFGNTNIVGTYTPPFKPINEYDLGEIVDQITKTNSDIIWIGISTPKQEELALELSKRLSGNIIVTVGAVFDFYTGRVRPAPKFLEKTGLEWIYRLIREPRRLYKRYFTIVPLFIYYNLREWAIFVKNRLIIR